MDSLISVVIPYCKERKYLLRCINSIKRQTYTDIEIILVSDNQREEIEYKVKVISTIKEAIKKAKGEYIFFCSNTSILTNNVLEELYVNIVKEGVDLSSVNVYVSNGVDYTEYFTQISVFGKLFRKNWLQDISIEENSEYGLQELIAKYLVKCNRIQESNRAIVYETDKAILSPEQTQKFEIETWKRVFELIGTDFSKKDGIGTKIKQTVENSYEEKEVEHKVSYLKNGDTQTFLIISEIISKKEEMVKGIEMPKIVEKTVESEKEESVDIEAFLEVMSGELLINYVIGKYRNGSLGLKTIIKSFFAWMKYKL